MTMTEPTPTSLDGWRRRFRDLLEQARLSALSPVERAALVVAIRRDADTITDVPERDDPWSSIGYRRH
jgi:hypothetical protein